MLHARAAAGEAAVVGSYQIVAFLFRDRFEVLRPGFREDPTRTLLVVPLDLLSPQEEDPAEDHLRHVLWMLLRIRQGQGAAPGPAEQLPPLDIEVLSNPLHVFNQIPGGVVAELGVWRAAAAATLIEQDDSVD
jgi:hypothetical protein